jgi:hypothetical protein
MAKRKAIRRILMTSRDVFLNNQNKMFKNNTLQIKIEL